MPHHVTKILDEETSDSNCFLIKFQIDQLIEHSANTYHISNRRSQEAFCFLKWKNFF